MVSTRSQSRRGRSEVSRHSVRPIESAWPAELSSPHTVLGKVAQLRVGRKARGSRGRLCRLHHRAGVTPKAKIRLVCSKNTLLKTLQCWKQARPWLPARGPGQSREPHLCRRPFLFGAIKPLPPGAASVHGTLAGASPGTDAGALPVPGSAPSIRAQQGAQGWGADQGGLLGLWGRGQLTWTRS